MATSVNIIEIQPFRSGWQVRSGRGKPPPFFTGACAVEHAIDYALERAEQSQGSEVRLLARNGEVITTIVKGAGSVKLRDRRSWRSEAP